MCRRHAISAAAVFLTAAGAMSASAEVSANAHVPVVQTEPTMVLPAGGEEFRRAVLGWLPMPLGKEVGGQDALEMPIREERLSSRFGIRHDPLGRGLHAHLGIDIPDTFGAVVHAAAGGMVIYAGWRGGYGNLVEIAHGDGKETRYGHLASMTVQSGDVVPQGAAIGSVGSTGRSTGPHLHFEVRQNGVALDPLTQIGATVARYDQAIPPPPTRRWGGYGEDGTALPQSRLR